MHVKKRFLCKFLRQFIFDIVKLGYILLFLLFSVLKNKRTIIGIGANHCNFFV